MKATGIVRRVDDLGRLVIPKEIRRAFGIGEGDAVDIFTSDEGIIIAKHDIDESKAQEAEEWLNDNRDLLNRLHARFTIEGCVTVCECVYGGERCFGRASCDSNDTFNPSIGMVYAFCRAAEEELPDNWE